MVAAAGIANQDGQRRLGSQAHDFFAVAFEETGALEEIERKITADAEFREDGEVGAGSFGLVGHLQDTGGIARKISLP